MRQVLGPTLYQFIPLRQSGVDENLIVAPWGLNRVAPFLKFRSAKIPRPAMDEDFTTSPLVIKLWQQ